MTDTLVISGYGDTLPSATIGAGSISLAPGFDFGALVVSGSLLEQYQDRQMTIPVVILQGTRNAMRADVEALTLAVSRPYFTLTWTPTGGLPMVFDCRDAQIQNGWDLALDRQGGRRVTLTFLASPHGKSTATEAVTGTAASGTRWAALAPTGVKGTAPGLVTDVEQVATDLRSSLFYVSPPGKNANPPVPLASAGSGVYTNLGNQLIVDQSGTMAVWLSFTTGITAGLRFGIQLDITERINGPSGDIVGNYISPTVLITMTSAMLTSRYVPLWNLTLPIAGSLGGPRTYESNVIWTNAAGGKTPDAIVPQDLLLLNTSGTVVMQATASAVRAYITPPTPFADINKVYASNASPYRTRNYTPEIAAVATGAPVQVYPQGSVMLLHTPRDSAPSFTATYQPRFLSERTV